MTEQATNAKTTTATKIEAAAQSENLQNRQRNALATSSSPSSLALKKTDSLINKSKAQKSQKRCPLKCHIVMIMIPEIAEPARATAMNFMGFGN